MLTLFNMPLWYDNFSNQVFLSGMQTTFQITPETSSERQFACDTCGKNYIHLRNLLRHMKHECGKEPSFSCSVCPYRAFQKVHVQKHMRRKHMKDWVQDPNLPTNQPVPPSFLPAYYWFLVKNIFPKSMFKL